MNHSQTVTRRAFCFSLLAAGVTIRPAHARPTSADVMAQRLDRKLRVEPLRFSVSSGRTIELTNYLPLRDRFTAYEVSRKELCTDRSFSELIPRIEPIREQIYWWSQDALDGRKRLQDWDTSGVEEFFSGLSSRLRCELRQELKTWFAAEVRDEELDGNDIVEIPDGRMIALRFFRDYCDDDLAQELQIKIVEGEHPGSTYFAAELGASIEQANALAKRSDLDWGFIQTTW